MLRFLEHRIADRHTHSGGKTRKGRFALVRPTVKSTGHLGRGITSGSKILAVGRAAASVSDGALRVMTRGRSRLR